MLYYLAHFSTFTFSELSHFFKTFLSQVINLKSPKNIINRYFQAKSSTSVHLLSSHNNANTMIWKLQEFGGQFTSIKQNMPKNFFWNIVIKNYTNSIPNIALLLLILFTVLPGKEFHMFSYNAFFVK